jgi:hypothetical protein
MTEDFLHRRNVGAAHEQEGGSGVAEVMKANAANLARGPELHFAARAATEGVILRRLDVAAALAPAFVQPRLDDPGAMECPAEHELELNPIRHHGPVGRWKHQLRGRSVDRPFEVRHQLRRDGDDLGATTLGRLAIVRVGDREQPARQIDVGLSQSEKLADVLFLDRTGLATAGAGVRALGTFSPSTGMWRGEISDGMGWFPPNAFGGWSIGIVAYGYRNTSTESSETIVLDPCGKLRWRVPGTFSWPLAIGFDDDLFVRDRVPSTGTYAHSIRRFARDGQLLAGPVDTRHPTWAFIGADRSLVLVTCDLPTTSEVVALDMSLNKLWSVPLGGCASSAVLDEMGKLFVVRQGNPPSLLSIQTTSPGQAAVSWGRNGGRDSHATHWLSSPWPEQPKTMTGRAVAVLILGVLAAACGGSGSVSGVGGTSGLGGSPGRGGGDGGRGGSGMGGLSGSGGAPGGGGGGGASGTVGTGGSHDDGGAGSDGAGGRGGDGRGGQGAAGQGGNSGATGARYVATFNGVATSFTLITASVTQVGGNHRFRWTGEVMMPDPYQLTGELIVPIGTTEGTIPCGTGSGRTLYFDY